MSRRLSIVKGEHQDSATPTYAQTLAQVNSASKVSSGLQQPRTPSTASIEPKYYGESRGEKSHGEAGNKPGGFPSGQVPQRRGLHLRPNSPLLASAGPPSPPWKETATPYQGVSPYPSQGMSPLPSHSMNPYPTQHNVPYRAQSMFYPSSQTLSSRHSQPTAQYQTPSMGSFSPQAFISPRFQSSETYRPRPSGSFPPPVASSPISQPAAPYQAHHTSSFPLQTMSSPLSGPTTSLRRRSTSLNPKASEFTKPSSSLLTPGVKHAVANIERGKDFKKFLAKDDVLAGEHIEGIVNRTLASSAEYTRFEKGLQERRRRYSRKE
ncbi:hypothetical protein IL306_009799 [Fusarium sp. DS 682]|nr:hypothetical protein IL306_009799 [Fusarium sp. DS 682]